MPTFRDVETAAYCPRKLYYRRREPYQPAPDRVQSVRAIACAYERHYESPQALHRAPLAVAPETFRRRIDAARERLDAWPELVDPLATDRFLEGKDARGVTHKVLADPLAPSLVFAGAPPDDGVWEPQSVRLVAAAKALAWEHERPVDVAFAEYPAHGVVRRVELTVRRTGAYRRALRVAESIDGPPERVASDAKCDPCEFADQCGVRTRSLGSMLRS